MNDKFAAPSLSENYRMFPVTREFVAREPRGDGAGTPCAENRPRQGRTIRLCPYRFRGLAAPTIGVQRDNIFQHLLFALIGLNAARC